MEFASLDLEIDGVQLRVKVGRDGDGDGLCDEDGKGNGVPCAPGSGVTRTALAAGNLVDDLQKLIKPAAPKRSTGKPKKDSRSSRILAKLPYKPGDKDRELRSTSKYRGQELEFSIDNIWDGVQKKGAVSAIKKFLGFEPDDDGPEASTESRKFLNAMRERVQRRKAKEISQATPRIAVTPEGLLAVLKDGRFKTQFESGTSEGVNSPIKRRKFEDEYLGIPTDLSDSDRPVYGYMPFPDKDGIVRHPGEYGEQIVVLKPDVRDRTTMTFGDSLDGELTGVSIDEDFDALPADRLEAAFEPFESAPAILHEMAAALDASDAVDFDLAGETSGIKNSWDYVEAQFHGGISLEDIEKVGIDRFNDNAEEMALALEANGIPWFFVGDEDETIQTWAESGAKSVTESNRTKEVLDGLGYKPGDVEPSKRYVDIASDSMLAFAQGILKRSEDFGFEIEGFEPSSTEKEQQAVELAEFLKERLPEATQEWFKKYVPNRTTHIATTNEALTQILKDGRFKSQHETRSSGGTLQPERRSAYELRDLGIPEDIDPTKRPIYGYMPRINVHNGKPALPPSHYGEHTVRLKSDVNDRSTMTFGDSLDAATPILMNTDMSEAEPEEILAFNSATMSAFENMAEELTGAKRDKSNLGATPNFSYIESQVHGGVSLEDIESVGLSLPDIQRLNLPNKRGTRERFDQFDLTDGDDWIDLVDHTEDADEMIWEIQDRLESAAKALGEKGIPFNFEFLSRIPGITTQSELTTDWLSAKDDLAKALREAHDNFSNKEWRDKYIAEEEARLAKRTAEAIAIRDAEAARLAKLGLSEDDFD